MLKLLKYFFYKIYSYSLSNGESDPVWAKTIVSFFLLANAYTFMDLILILTNSKISSLPFIVFIGFAFIILHFSNTLFTKDGKEKTILEEFQHATVKRGYLNLLLIVYIVFSISLFIYTGGIVRSLNSN